MVDRKRRVVLLGPQRFVQTIGRHLRDAGIEGKVATVTAGWQERESELTELDHFVGVPSINLELFGRAEAIMREDPELMNGLHERHDRLRTLSQAYRIRLAHALDSARELFLRKGDASILDPEREAAIEAVRRLDTRQLDRKLEIQREFDEKWHLAERPGVIAHRKAIAEVLRGVSALVITGGHVGVLRNRLWLFDVFEALGDRPIYAWSAGAMVLASRIVLFHDSPPQGAGNAEVHAYGFGLCEGVVPLPHARQRLDLEDTKRVSLLARRFSPAACVTLEEGGALTFDGDRWSSTADNRILKTDGTLEVATEAMATA